MLSGVIVTVVVRVVWVLGSCLSLLQTVVST